MLLIFIVFMFGMELFDKLTINSVVALKLVLGIIPVRILNKIKCVNVTKYISKNVRLYRAVEKVRSLLLGYYCLLLILY